MENMREFTEAACLLVGAMLCAVVPTYLTVALLRASLGW